jgi:type II secretory pathway pseudopilin PulG
MTASRRGLGLVELMVGLALLGIVGALVARIVAVTTRSAVRVRERSARSATLRSAALAVAREVRGLGPGEVRIAADTLRYRARRGDGVACVISGAGVSLGRAGFRGWRQPQAGRDSLAVLDRDTGTWHVGAIAAVSAGTCPDGAAAIVVAGGTTWSGPVPAPVRVLEWVELRAYQSGGSWWLGARSLRPTDAIQPLAGPIAPRGAAFARVPLGAADTVLEARITVPPLPSGSGRADSTVLRVPLARGLAP